jgi:Tfp pilus assembly protein PilV
MLRTAAIATGGSLRREDGMTLIELLVVLVAGMVITAALFTILDVTLRQTTRTFSRVDATQRSRSALQTIENELQSACVADGVTPVQATGGTGGVSANSSVIFVTGSGNAASVNPVEHELDFNAALKTLTDKTFVSTGGAPPNWTFSSTASGTQTLLTNVAQSGVTPVFQYFGYQQPTNSSGVPYTDSAGNPYMMLLDGTSSVPGTSIIPTASPLAVPLSTTAAQQAAEVLITLAVGPGGGSGENTQLSDGAVAVTDSIVLRITPEANHVGAGATFGPCQ